MAEEPTTPQRLWTLRAALLLVVALAIPACAGDHRSAPNFQTSVSLQDGTGQALTTFTVGQPITFVLSVQNLTTVSQTITLPTGQIFDFLAFRANQTPIVWRWSNNIGFIQAFQYLTFAPGETKTYSAVWNQQDDSGIAVSSGNYDAQGYVATGEEFTKTLGANYTPSEMRSMMVPFSIQ